MIYNNGIQFVRLGFVFQTRSCHNLGQNLLAALIGAPWSNCIHQYWFNCPSNLWSWTNGQNISNISAVVTTKCSENIHICSLHWPFLTTTGFPEMDDSGIVTSAGQKHTDRAIVGQLATMWLMKKQVYWDNAILFTHWPCLNLGGCIP